MKIDRTIQLYIKCAAVFLLTFSQRVIAQENPYQTQVNTRLEAIKNGLTSFIFVMRFESVETPCVCIDSTDKNYATPGRRLINSNYRINLTRYNSIDSGSRCLNQYCARYMKLTVDSYDTTSLKLAGKVDFSYGYPAGNLIQLLGFAHRETDKTSAFFNSLIINSGKFEIYPELDKYRISIKMDKDGPYRSKDIVYGYLEIVSDPYANRPEPVYCFNFDRMSIHRGDDNNAISLKFTSTSFSLESEYYTRRLFEVLRFIDSEDKHKKANALWVKNFFSNPACPSCKFIYEQAAGMVIRNGFLLPNTQPQPAH